MARAEYKKWQEPDNLIKLQGWARDGLTNEQIAKKIGVRRETISVWCSKYPNIANALKKGKEVIDYEIENSLISTMKKHRIKTTTYKMVKKDDLVLKAERTKFMNMFKLDHPNATKEQILIATAENVAIYERIPMTETVTEVDPNVSSMIFWLKNRKPDVYRDQTFQKLNEANARKAIADAGISEAQLKSLKEEDNPSNRTVIVDDVAKMKELRDHENSTDNEGD